MSTNDNIEDVENGATAGPPENYKAPAMKSVKEIVKTDADDESLEKYKKTLLGSAAAGEEVVVDENNPKNVIVRSLTLLSEGRPDLHIDLSPDTLKSMENKTFTIKEGCHYRLRIDFHVQREIVSGLKYIQKVHRHGVQVDKDDLMVGSYAPKKDLQSFTTPLEEAPSGMLHRGSYKVKSLFTDDDKFEWLKWEWTLEIKKDWA